MERFFFAKTLISLLVSTLHVEDEPKKEYTIKWKIVLILLTKKFGRDKEYFGSLLKTFPEKIDAKYDSTEIGAARNLFYVAVTRATKKLCVAYLADEQEQLSDVELQLGSIFTKVNSLT